MTKQRVSETDHGIVGEFNVSMYDQMQRNLRDRGMAQEHAGYLPDRTGHQS